MGILKYASDRDLDSERGSSLPQGRRSMTPQELEILRSLGRGLLFSLASSFLSVLLYAPCLILFSFSIYLFRRGAFKRMLTTISVICFVLTTADFIFNILWLVNLAKASELQDRQSLANRRLQIRATLLPSGLVWYIADRCLPMIADSVLVWRACVLRRWHKRVSIPLVILLTWNIVTVIWYLILYTYRTVKMHRQPQDRGCLGVLLRLVLGSSLSVNLAATAVIGHTYWEQRKTLRALNKTMTMPQRMLLLLTESGAALCFCQLFGLILTMLGDPTSQFLMTNQAVVVTSLLRITMTVIYRYSAIYPTFIVMLARLPAYSFVETCYTLQHDRSGCMDTATDSIPLQIRSGV